jgi:hypothetical protein
LDFAAEKGIPVFQTAAKPWSTGKHDRARGYRQNIDNK